ncbi:hypothetical protein CICLE_v10017621mg, partial [Citrus x clementina]
MAKNSRIPKFGDWDNDNIPYTTFFENARREKAGVRMNPNDPEENPEAFMRMRGTLGRGTDGDCQPVRASRHVDSYKSKSTEKRHIEEQMGMGHNPRGRNTFDHQRSRSRKSTMSEFSSDKSSAVSDHSLPQPSPRRLKSDKKNGLGEGTSVPKFGAWDETDPTSGEGFTVIFNKVKEEKQIASTQFPVVPEQTSDYSDGQRSNEGSWFRSK